MRKHNVLSLLLAVVMMITVTSSRAITASAEAGENDADQQLSLIYSQLDKLQQNDGQNTWYYAVTDLDHDGNLEFVAASLHPQDRSTNLKVWEVSDDHTAVTECVLEKDADESFPDIMTDTADTFYDKGTGAWYYLVNDNIVISDTEVYSIKTAVSLKDGTLGYTAYAVEHTVLENAYRNVSHTDINGFPISQDQYNAAATNALAGMERSNTAFEWLTAEDAGDLARLTDSYAVFSGTKEPTETFPVPKPAALEHPEATPTPAPAATPVPAQNSQPIYLSITKNPTNENRKVGGNAIFVACANAYESLSWTFVSPTGGEYSPANFLAGSGASVTGEYSTTITVNNVEDWMNGWGAFCTFYYQGQTARTSTAYIYVTANQPAPAPAQPTYGSMGGYAYSGGGGYAIDLPNGTQVFVDAWNCNVYGDFYEGCPCVVYYTDHPSNSTVYAADIYGAEVYIVDQGGWAGSNYQDDSLADNGYTYGDTFIYEIHEESNPDGSTYDTVTCPNCGREVSMAYDDCPYCGFPIWD